MLSHPTRHLDQQSFQIGPVQGDPSLNTPIVKRNFINQYANHIKLFNRGSYRTTVMSSDRKLRHHMALAQLPGTTISASQFTASANSTQLMRANHS